MSPSPASPHYTDDTDDPDGKRPPTLLAALVPVALMVSLLGCSVAIFGADSSYGPNQIALLLSAGVAGVIGLRHGFTWEDLEDGIVASISVALPAALILLAVGALIGTWILAGTVPYLIVLGATLLTPEWFYPATCVICALVSVSIGSSWTTAGTLGVALMGSAQAMDMSPAITAGAVISGAYFGDKMSPLSDTTNLAAAVTRVNLFDHIRNMLWTAAPAMIVTLLVFSVLGRGDGVADMALFEALERELRTEFTLNVFALAPLALLLYLSLRRYPPLPVIGLGALAGGVVAMLLQFDAAAARAPEGMAGWPAALAGTWIALFDGYATSSAVPQMADLLDRGGMSSMLNTVWLILCAMTFGGVMERTGLLQRLVADLLRLASGTPSLQLTTLGTAITTNVLASDQYMAVAIPGRLYERAYVERGLHPLNLSRGLEDGGTLTSVLIPWNTCGAYMSATLGIATFSYLPWCLFNLASVAFSALWAVLGIGVVRGREDIAEPPAAASPAASRPS
ncbi:MAG TPA: Na+/H+ antiporter NhaC [Pseudomonadales bacterium]|nr:Na+/H+ antiporter NhaC [Pseudomonadales bacterium]